MKNGRADHGDDEPNDPKIARIEEERRRRQLGLGPKPGQGSGGGAKPRSAPRVSGNLKEWLIGAVLVAMAVGFIASLVAPLVR